MWRTLLIAWSGAMLVLVGGCATGPLLDNPTRLVPDPSITVENPVYVPLGPPAYNTVFEKVLDIVDDYFEIAATDRYDGVIKTLPRVAPGFERILLPGSPDYEQRLLATLQSVRLYAIVKIKVADDGGFFIDVKVYKELEDVPRPTHATAGMASFCSDNTVDRRYEVVVPHVTETNWIPIGEDVALEQLILQRIKKCL
jgi:hypothetical protein